MLSLGLSYLVCNFVPPVQKTFLVCFGGLFNPFFEYFVTFYHIWKQKVRFQEEKVQILCFFDEWSWYFWVTVCELFLTKTANCCCVSCLVIVAKIVISKMDSGQLTLLPDLKLLLCNRTKSCRWLNFGLHVLMAKAEIFCWIYSHVTFRNRKLRFLDF